MPGSFVSERYRRREVSNRTIKPKRTVVMSASSSNARKGRCESWVGGLLHFLDSCLVWIFSRPGLWDGNRRAYPWRAVVEAQVDVEEGKARDLTVSSVLSTATLGIREKAARVLLKK